MQSFLQYVSNGVDGKLLFIQTAVMHCVPTGGDDQMQFLMQHVSTGGDDKAQLRQTAVMPAWKKVGLTAKTSRHRKRRMQKVSRAESLPLFLNACRALRAHISFHNKLTAESFAGDPLLLPGANYCKEAGRLT